MANCFSRRIRITVAVLLCLFAAKSLQLLSLLSSRCTSAAPHFHDNSVVASKHSSSPRLMCAELAALETNSFSTNEANTTSNDTTQQQSTYQIAYQQRCVDYIEQELADRVRTDIAIEERMIQTARERAEKVKEAGGISFHHVPLDFSFASGDPLAPKRAEWIATTFPDINIVEFPKAGTSKLYAILTAHQEATTFDIHKEKCMLNDKQAELSSTSKESKHYSSLVKIMYSRHSGLHRANAAQPKKGLQTVNACLNSRDILVRYEYLGKPENKKFIFVFRDPADWLWACWNYWLDSSVDARPAITYDWATPELHYRSPELFHEWIVAGDRTMSGTRMLQRRDRTISDPMVFIEAVGRERILFLKGEDMLPDKILQPGGFLDKLSQFTNLDKNKFDIATLKTKVNCNDSKGVNTTCGESESSSYAIAGFRKMLPQTRKLIYILYWEECKIWEREFGIVYPDCLAAVDPI